jgi:hypothetical protein
MYVFARILECEAASPHVSLCRRGAYPTLAAPLLQRVPPVLGFDRFYPAAMVVSRR